MSKISSELMKKNEAVEAVSMEKLESLKESPKVSKELMAEDKAIKVVSLEELIALCK